MSGLTTSSWSSLAWETEMKALTLDDLIEVLEKKREEHGNLKVHVNTQEGWAYSLYGKDAITVLEVMAGANGEMEKILQIG